MNILWYFYIRFECFKNSFLMSFIVVSIINLLLFFISSKVVIIHVYEYYYFCMLTLQPATLLNYFIELVLSSTLWSFPHYFVISSVNKDDFVFYFLIFIPQLFSPVYSHWLISARIMSNNSQDSSTVFLFLILKQMSLGVLY